MNWKINFENLSFEYLRPLEMAKWFKKSYKKGEGKLKKPKLLNIVAWR